MNLLGIKAILRLIIDGFIIAISCAVFKLYLVFISKVLLI